MTTINGLREHFRLTDEQLDSIIQESDLFTLGGLFGPWSFYASAPGLRLSNGEKYIVNTDLNLIDNAMKMEKALTMWRNHDILQATFRNLLDVVLKLQEGDVAMKICKYLGKVDELVSSEEEVKEKQTRSQQTDIDGEITLRLLTSELMILNDPIKFGIGLGIELHVLDGIQKDHTHDIDQQKIALFSYISRNHKSLKISWDAVADSLENFVKMNDLAEHIRDKYHCQRNGTEFSHHPTLQDNLSSRPSIYEDPVMSSYGDYLRSRYSVQVSTSSTQWLPVPTNKVLKLAMISKETVQRGKIDDEFVRLSITGKVDDILQRKTPVDLENIIPTNTEIGRNVVLTEGAPGSGKSTLSLHICQEWGRGKLFQQYKAVILVSLRDPKVQKATTIVDILPCANKTMADQAESAIQSNYGEGVLWVLDGWDELPPHLPQDWVINKLIQLNIVQEDPLHLSDLIITSRPVSSASLHPLVSARVEVLGFTPRELEQYFTECLEGDSKAVQSLLDDIKMNPVVEGSCYLPLNASIVANIYIAGNHTLPNTVHGIFSSLVQCSLQRYLKDRLGKSTVVNCITSLDKMPTELRKTYTQLCKLAYYGVKNNKVSFTLSDLQSLRIPADIYEVGLLQAVPSIVSTSREVYYCFLHLSIQELLAAVHISHMTSSKQIAVFETLFDQPRFSAVFQFYAGITKLRTSRRFLSKLPRSLHPGPASVYDLVRRIIHQEQQNDYSTSKPLLVSLLNCLYEAEDPSLCQFVAEQLKGSLDLASTTLSPLDCLSIGYFLAVVCTAIHGDFIVWLTSCSIGDQECKYLANSICKYLDTHTTETIQLQLWMGNNDIHEEGAHHIAEILQTTNVVSKLYLSYNHITGVGLKSLCEALLTNTSLTELDLSSCSLVISDDNGPVLTDMLRRNKTLKDLNLFNNRELGDSACQYIATGLKDNTSLNKLDLHFCNLTDQDLDTLSTGLNNYLEVLFIKGNDRITMSGLQSLANKLLTPTQLRYIMFPGHLESCKTVLEDVNDSRRRSGLQEIRFYFK